MSTLKERFVEDEIMDGKRSDSQPGESLSEEEELDLGNGLNRLAEIMDLPLRRKASLKTRLLQQHLIKSNHHLL